MTSLTRRDFVQGAGLSAVIGAVSGKRVLSARSTTGTGSTRPGIYEELGIRPLINAAGTYTALSASLMPREVSAAMEEAARRHVSIPELQAAAGARITSLVGAEAALVTTGCAAALTTATAACVSGTDEEMIRRVPEASGMKDEVIIQRSHRFSYDHAIRNVGVTLVEVETEEELRAAVNDRTAMMFFLNYHDPKGDIKRARFAELAKELGIPSLIDAAADLPPAENLRAFTALGYDMVAFSGGKGLRGPQCSGLLLGRKDLIDAAFLNGSPHSDSVGRIAKVGKEEIVGLLTAVELYVEKDHEAEWGDWEDRVRHIGAAVTKIGGVTAERFVPEIANQVPHLAITWDTDSVDIDRESFIQALRDGEPRIEPRPGSSDDNRLEIGVWMMQPGEHRIVASRCAEILGAASRS